MGELFEKFSMVASKNPSSWTQKPYNADEITTPSPQNRLVTYPYTKRMCANNLVDQAGTILITSEEVAKSLNIEKKHWVYVMGGADFKNISQIYRRPRLDNSPAVREGSRLGLKQAGLKLSDIDKFDLYSCFPSIVEIFMKELEIEEDDQRDLTVTGGLPYFGTPLSNYSLHAVINTVDLIRANPSLKVMVIANGGYNTKQSIGIYGNSPPKEEWGNRDDSRIQESILNEALPEPMIKADGKLIVEGYSIIYDREGPAKRAVILGTLENKKRALALVTEPEMLATLENQEIVGKKFVIKYNEAAERNIALSME
jgi:acetyl-CoA C-acetyltransferase